MDNEVKIAFQALVEAKAKMHSIKNYLKQNHDTDILGLYPEIHVYDNGKFYSLAKELKAEVSSYPWESSSGIFDTKLSFDVTSKEYGFTFEVYTLKEKAKGGENK